MALSVPWWGTPEGTGCTNRFAGSSCWGSNTRPVGRHQARTPHRDQCMWYPVETGAPAAASAALAFLGPAPAPFAPQRAATQPTTAALERSACARGGSSLHTMGRRVKRRGHSTKGAWCASRLPLCRSGGEPSTPPPQWRRRSGASAPILSPHPLHRRTARQTFPTADRRRQITSTGRKGGAHREPSPVGVDVGVGRGKFHGRAPTLYYLPLLIARRARHGTGTPLGSREETRYENQEGFTRTATSNNCVTRDLVRWYLWTQITVIYEFQSFSRCPPSEKRPS